MSLSYQTYVLGPLENNTYLLVDQPSGDCVIIDPSFNAVRIVQDIRAQGLNLKQIWLTHAHFDHICGVPALVDNTRPKPEILLHPADLPLYRNGGGADLFGMRFDPSGDPQNLLEHGQNLNIGDSVIEIRHTPGHTPGHVIFYVKELSTAFCGDLIFQGSVGRTDLPGGDQDLLLASIASEILSLPSDTKLLSGHGAETSVGEEQKYNPFLR
jgi:hydroxyacylglutathione hydrolase